MGADASERRVVYSIGFTKKRAETFFDLLREARIGRVLDIRLNPSSQLAGFAKREDLPFLLRELCHASYEHEPLLAPTKELFEDVKKRRGDWETFRGRFTELMRTRRVEEVLDRRAFDIPTALLCSESDASHCHRHLVIDYLREAWGDLKAVHL